MSPATSKPRGHYGNPRGQEGQSTAELALLLPVLLLLMLVVVQVGLVARDQVSVQHAAREAARQAALAPGQSTAASGAAAAGGALDPERLTVAVSGSRSRGDLLTVNIAYRSPTEVPVVGAFVGDVDLSAAAVVRIE